MTPTDEKVASGDTPSGKKAIRIRMYRVGFGDCILVSFPTQKRGSATDGYSHILVDCGVHSGGDIGTIERVVDNIANVTQRKLALVIATHAHRDHISGFGKFGDRFSEFNVKAVWLPWTWNPKDDEASKLKMKQAAVTAQLAQHFSMMGARANPAAVAAIENMTGNEEAISLLTAGFNVGAKVSYWEAGKTPRGADLPIPGLSVRLLGPPRSEDFLARQDPPAGQHYLRMDVSDPSKQDSVALFGAKWASDQGSLRTVLPEKVKEGIKVMANSPLDDLAFSIDDARNNESLVTLFTFKGKCLLFTGDAQYGSWSSWLSSGSSKDLLLNIDFLKVAHHGSVNATPKEALENMSDGRFAAMVSTQSVPWKSIPRPPLMARLDEKTGKRLIRTDWLEIAGAPMPLDDSKPSAPAQLASGFKKGELWFDYLLEL